MLKKPEGKAASSLRPVWCGRKAESLESAARVWISLPLTSSSGLGHLPNFSERQAPQLQKMNLMPNLLGSVKIKSCQTHARSSVNSSHYILKKKKIIKLWTRKKIQVRPRVETVKVPFWKGKATWISLDWTVSSTVPNLLQRLQKLAH